MSKISGVMFSLALSSVTLGQECTNLWHKNLSINPPTPRPNSGDTFAGYGLLGFKNDHSTKFVLKANFSKTRFTSFESYITMDKLDYDEKYDFQIEPDEGSVNPFREGVAIDAPNRAYTLELVPAEGKSTKSNVLHFSPTEDIYSFYFRMYGPNNGVVLQDSDMPRVFAYDLKTGEPKACPEFVYTSYEPNYPQFVATLVASVNQLKFKSRTVKNAQNHAIPTYLYALKRLRLGDVIVIRMKVPTFFNSFSGVGSFQKTAEVRYFSFCAQNFVVNQTLLCLPDYLVKTDADGYATFVYGGGPKVKEAAEKRGFNYLEDRREKKQKAAGFVYRNLFPSDSFASAMYQGEYLPIGDACTAKEFLNDQCDV